MGPFPHIQFQFRAGAMSRSSIGILAQAHWYVSLAGDGNTRNQLTWPPYGNVIELFRITLYPCIRVSAITGQH